jgi:hypothetical protein
LTTSPVRTALAVVALLALPAATAAAAPQRLAQALYVADPAIVGGKTLFGQTDILGYTADANVARYSVKTVSPGEQPRTLYSADASQTSSGEEDDDYAFSFAASGTNLAVLDQGDYEGAVAHWEDWLYAGAQGVRPAQVLHCTDEAGENPAVVPFALDGTRLVYVDGSCPPHAPQAVVDGPVRLAVPAGETVDAVAVAGDFLAYSTVGANVRRVVVARVSTGAEAYHLDVPASGALAVAPDGTVAFAGHDNVFGQCGTPKLGWASPAAPFAHIIAGAEPCSAHIALAGGRIGYLEVRYRAFRTTDLSGHEVTVARDVTSFAMAADHAAVVLPDCAGQALWNIDAIDAPAGRPRAAKTCPTSLRSRRVLLRGRTANVRLSCPRGCNGLIGIGPSRHGRDAARSQPYDLTAGTATIRLPLSPRDARRLAGRRRAYVLMTDHPTPDGDFRIRRPIPVSLRR